MNRLFTLLLASLLVLPAAALAQPDEATRPAPAKKGKLVFVATTGLEDIGTLSSSFRHAKEAVKSGHLSEVVWLTYGRAVVALDPTVKAVPEEVRKAAEEAKAAGVRLVACGNALKKFDSVRTPGVRRPGSVPGCSQLRLRRAASRAPATGAR